MPISLPCYGAVTILLSVLVQGNADATECILNSLKTADIQKSRTFREKNTKRFRRLYGNAYKEICDEISPPPVDHYMPIFGNMIHNHVNMMVGNMNNMYNLDLMAGPYYEGFTIINIGGSTTAFVADQVVPHGRMGRRINRRGNRQVRKRRFRDLQGQTYQHTQRHMNRTKRW